MRNRKCISHAFIKSSASCLSVIVLTLLFALPVSASYYPNDPVGWKDGDTLSTVIYAILDSWGISISKSSSDSVSITEYAQQLLDDYIEDSNQIADDIWRGIQLGVNKFGQLIGNNYLVDFVSGFADWLINSYDLTDNGVFPIYSSGSLVYFGNNPAIEISSALDTFPLSLVRTNNNNFEGVVNSSVTTSSGTNLGYPIYLANASYTYNNVVRYVVCIYSPVSYRYFRFDSVDSDWYYRGGSYNTQNYGHTSLSDGKDFKILSLPIINTPQLSSQNDIRDYVFNGGVITSRPSSGSLTINTGVIDIPTSTPADGIIIDVPGTNWGDSLFDILDLIERLIILYDGTQLEVISIIDTLSNLLSTLNTPISVENIPGGVVLDYDDYDIALDLEWRYVEQYFNLTPISSGLALLKTLVFDLPSPFMLYFTVVVLVVVAYGFIRMGRDSH